MDAQRRETTWAAGAGPVAAVAAGSARPARRRSPRELWAALPPNLGDYVLYAAWHLACLSVFWVGVSWRAVAVCAGSYLLRMFGLIAGHHRYFSHRSYTLSRPMQFLIAVLGTCSAQRGLLWWVAAHRHHHRFSDTEEDVHSPVLRSVLYAHSGWFLDPKQRAPKLALVPDLAKYPELVWLSDWSSIPVALYGLGLYLAFGLEGFVWGFLVSTVLVWHGIHALSSFAHTPGGFRRYPTSDYSRNKWFLALVTLGEGWHNNHHYYPASARHGFFWWEIDLAYYVLRALAWVGLVRDLKLPPRHVVEGDLPGLTRRLARFGDDLAAVHGGLAGAVAAVAAEDGPERAAAERLQAWLGERFERARREARALFIQVPDERLRSLADLRREVLAAASDLLSPAWSAAAIGRLRGALEREIDRLAASLPFEEARRAVAAMERPAPVPTPAEAGDLVSLAS
jgi:stearoyl-CoA desaturase (delta-9 desaturase)